MRHCNFQKDAKNYLFFIHEHPNGYSSNSENQTFEMWWKKNYEKNCVGIIYPQIITELSKWLNKS